MSITVDARRPARAKGAMAMAMAHAARARGPRRRAGTRGAPSAGTSECDMRVKSLSNRYLTLSINNGILIYSCVQHMLDGSGIRIVARVGY